MTWDARLLQLFDDLEQQAEGLALASRDEEVEELGRAAYSTVELASRLHASTGADVQLRVRGAGTLRGRLVRVGAGWCLLEAQGAEMVVVAGAILAARGLSGRAVVEPARGTLTRLGLGSVLRSLEESRDVVVLVDVDGAWTRGSVLRVGADFVEALADDGVTELVPLDALAVVRRG